ncbi:hypothetical protein JET64_22390 [Pseudomonas putida]|nr:hypothetical protein [Pseudomonas putida]
MSADFDEGSFPKARGWLLAFSSLLIALWFFGADLKSVSVLGTKINFTRNTEHVWLVALVIVAYLLLRFYQHQPNISYSGWKEYKQYYSSFMLSFMWWLSERSIEKEFLESGEVSGSSALEYDMVKCVIETRELTRVTEPSEKRRHIRGMKDMLVIHAHCKLSQKKGDRVSVSQTYKVVRVCPYWLICLCIWLSRIQLWVRTSYATEHLLPYIWGGFAAVVCFFRWYAAIIQ